MSGNQAAGIRGTAYELFLVLLSLLSIVNAVLILVPFLSGAGREVVIVMETLLTPFFLVDFLLRLADPDRGARTSSTPSAGRTSWRSFPLLRVFRLFRVVVVVRALQARGPAQIADDLIVSRAAATFFTTIFLVIVVLEVSGMLILDAERGHRGRQHQDAERRAVVGLRDHHDRGLRRPVPRDAAGPDHRHLPPDGGRGALQRLHRLHRERVSRSPAPPPAAPARDAAGRIRSPSSTRSAASWSSRTIARASCRAGSTTWSGRSWRGATASTRARWRARAGTPIRARTGRARDDPADLGRDPALPPRCGRGGGGGSAAGSRSSWGIRAVRSSPVATSAHWSIPKGEVDLGEDLYVEARREFEEETGHAPPAPPAARRSPSASIVQKGGKVVHAWALEGDLDPAAAVSNTFSMRWPPGSWERSRPSRRSTASRGSIPRRRAAASRRRRPRSSTASRRLLRTRAERRASAGARLGG